MIPDRFPHVALGCGGTGPALSGDDIYKISRVVITFKHQRAGNMSALVIQ